MKNNKTIGLIFLLGLLIFTSCKKEGCIDESATNYNEEANIDDGSCFYPNEANAIVFFGGNVSYLLNEFGDTTLHFYVDDIYQTSITSDDFVTGYPDCGQANTMSVYKNLGTLQTLTSEFKIYNQDSILIWQGNIKFEANECYRLVLNL